MSLTLLKASWKGALESCYPYVHDEGRTYLQELEKVIAEANFALSVEMQVACFARILEGLPQADKKALIAAHLVFKDPVSQANISLSQKIACWTLSFEEYQFKVTSLLDTGAPFEQVLKYQNDVFEGLKDVRVPSRMREELPYQLLLRGRSDEAKQTPARVMSRFFPTQGRFAPDVVSIQKVGLANLIEFALLSDDLSKIAWYLLINRRFHDLDSLLAKMSKKGDIPLAFQCLEWGSLMSQSKDHFDLIVEFIEQSRHPYKQEFFQAFLRDLSMKREFGQECNRLEKRLEELRREKIIAYYSKASFVQTSTRGISVLVVPSQERFNWKAFLKESYDRITDHPGKSAEYAQFRKGIIDGLTPENLLGMKDPYEARKKWSLILYPDRAENWEEATALTQCLNEALKQLASS